MAETEIIIKPSRGWVAIDFKELWRYRELLFALTIRDIKIRYKQTFLGAGWAILQPLLATVVFTVFFGKMAKIPTDGIPYPIFSFSGVLLWQYFSQAITYGGNSLNYSENFIKKIYFPRIIIPVSSTFTGILDYAIASVVMLGMMLYYHYPITPALLLVPLVLGVTWMLAVGTSLWLSALNVEYKDIRYALPFFVQIWFFISPVIYPSSILKKYQWIANINPMTGLINAHRSVFLHTQKFDAGSFFISTGITLFVLLSGLYYFKKTERTFADIL